MKTNRHSLILLLTAIFLAFSQPVTIAGGDPSFRQLQQIKLPFTPAVHYYTHTGDFNYFLCSTKSDMLMIDGINGKILWQKNFEKDFKNKKFSYQFWNKTANVILVYDEDTKKGIATKYFIDGKTGNTLWTSDKYISDLGNYELSKGFTNYFDDATNGVLLPTRESVDLVNVVTGKTIWSRPITLTGKSKDFDCFIMSYYDLVKIITGKDNEVCVTVDEGKEVTDVNAYFNKKKYLADRQHAKILDIPEKNMYVLMISETVYGFAAITGFNLPSFNMNFMAFNDKTDELIWSKNYHVVCEYDWVSNDDYFAKLHYDGVNLYIEHNPSPKTTSGLTVLDPLTGEMKWETTFTASERKSSGLTKTLTTPFPAPDPVTIDGKTYVVNKVKNIVSCFDAEKGTKIWDSEKFPDAQKIPTLILSNGLLIMGYGGDALKCASIVQDKGPNIERYEFNNKDKYGINAYDAATGKIVWSNETIEKKAKDKFDLIAGLQLINGQLFCATDKNFFILDPKNGDVLKNTPIAAEKLGDTWKMFYFPKENKIVLNCEKGIVKIDPASLKIEGIVKTSTVPFYQASKFMNGDDDFQDYAIFTEGDGAKMTFKEFASIDLEKMTIRGVGDGELLFKKVTRFSEGGEMFYDTDGEELTIYSVK